MHPIENVISLNRQATVANSQETGHSPAKNSERNCHDGKSQEMAILALAIGVVLLDMEPIGQRLVLVVDHIQTSCQELHLGPTIFR